MRKILLLGVTLLFACMIFGCSSDKKESAQVSTNQGATAQSGENAQTGANSNLAPGAVTWAAEDTHGQVHQATEWVGKQPTVINFWGTWCPPCRREIPELIKLYEEYKPKGVEIVSLAVRDNASQVATFSNEAGMKWVMLMGSSDIADAYGGIQGVPTTIFLDKNGVEVKRFVGGNTYEGFKPAFDAILKGYTPASM